MTVARRGAFTSVIRGAVAPTPFSTLNRTLAEPVFEVIVGCVLAEPPVVLAPVLGVAAAGATTVTAIDGGAAGDGTEGAELLEGDEVLGCATRVSGAIPWGH